MLTNFYFLESSRSQLSKTVSTAFTRCLVHFLSENENLRCFHFEKNPDISRSGQQTPPPKKRPFFLGGGLLFDLKSSIFEILTRFLRWGNFIGFVASEKIWSTFSQHLLTKSASPLFLYPQNDEKTPFFAIAQMCILSFI